MNQKLCTAFMAVFVLAIIACSDNVAGSSEDPNTMTARNNQSSSSNVEISSSAIIESSSSIKTLSSSSEKVVLCKVSGDWGSYGCHIELPHGEGDLWSSDDLKVKTNAYAKDLSNFGNHAGEFFFETDSLDGGRTQIFWTDGQYVIPEFKGYLSANLWLDKGSLPYDPYFKIGFYVAGFDSNGMALSADISNWNGICIMYSGTISPTLQLDLGDSLNKKLGYVLPSVTMSKEGKPQCYDWNQFKQPNSEKEREFITGEDAAKHVVKIIFLFQSQVPERYEGDGFNILAIGTNRDE